MRLYFSVSCLMLFLINISYAADSTISISGYLKDNMCSISVDSQNFSVDLMSNASRQFSRVGATTAPVPFRVVFDKCGDSVVALKIGFSGVSDTDNIKLVKVNPGVSTARGVGIQILDSNQNALSLNLGRPSLNWIRLVAGQPNTLNFYARLMATRVPVTAGIVNATA